jgi:pilus assembly protein CpaF
MESPPSQPKLGTEEPMKAVTIADLVVAALRYRPDRIILGELRGGEAWDLLQALNTGHLGSFSTIHANSAVQALSRLANLVLMSSVDTPLRGTKDAIALAIDIVVHIDHIAGQRRVAQVIRVDGYDARRRPVRHEHALPRWVCSAGAVILTTSRRREDLRPLHYRCSLG